MNPAALGWACRAGAGYLGVVGRTSRYRISGRAAVEAARAEGPMLWAFWHNRLLGPLVPYRDRGIGVVISRSDDGELISRIVERFGYVPIRGSSSRGGAMALRGVLRHLASGRDVALTPDGPRGPRYRVQPGVAMAAVRSGVPVVPVGVAYSRRWVAPSWDRFQVPLPFGRVELVLGPPLRFGRGEPIERVRAVIQGAILRATERADARVGRVPP
ncbi:lysophospholipid acyltransferase family protein [Deferrisoma camini]|uniref:lysophospholipid acyltransferase family protein n=1 Tax=Deferrisoma camini TaxID=1035120 RepID=UPI00046D84AE|nr:lysophospholipid acyltransferase family protein [Deferrisoma camini]